MYRRWSPGACLVLVLMVAACAGTPTSPQISVEERVVGRPGGSGGTQATFHLTGVVRDGRGNPVAGATVTAFQGGSAVSNAAGEFEITFLRTSGLQVTKPGYEPTWGGGIHFQTGHWNPVLHEVIRIPVGGSVQMTVTPDDAIRSYRDDFFDGNYRARIVRIDVRARMRVQLQLAADDGGHAVLCIQNSACYESFPVAIPADAGAEMVAELMNGPYPKTSRTFTLTTGAIPSE